MGFNLAILISGRGSNMLNIVDACNNKTLSSKVKIIISNNKNSTGLAKVKKKGIKTKIIHENQIKKFEKKLSQILLEEKINLICLAGFMRIISPYFIKEYKNKILNIHPALLPAFPGLDAQKQAIEFGSKFSGCTVHFVDEGVDTGPIIIQEIVKINSNDTEKSLSKKILVKEHEIYPKAVELFAKKKISIKGRKVKISN